jgi:O-antigen/teichoic acid export membrane protein
LVQFHFSPRASAELHAPCFCPSDAMRHSIIRRSLLLTIFYIAGHGFYYLLILIANAMLDPSGFGRLYTGWAILNILVAPISIIALLLSGYFAEGNAKNGPVFVSKLLARIAAIALPWSVGTLILLEALFYVTGTLIGVDSISLMLVLPLTAMSFLGVEIVRASLQGTLRFTIYGVSWFLWCVAQCALGAIGLLLTHSPWGCFAGMLAANLLTLGCLCWAVAAGGPTAPSSAVNEPTIATYSLRRAIAFCSAFVGFVLFNNADILLAYLILNPSDLGVYTSSSVLPKAIVTATQPVVQIILPVVISIQGEGRDTSQAVMKAIVAAFGLGAVAFAVLWPASDLVCGSLYGIRFCSVPLMLTLAAAAVPLSVIRTLVTADVAHGRYWLPHLPFVAIVAFAGLLTLARAPGQAGDLHLATIYLFSCWGLLVCWVFAGVFRGRLLARSKSPPSTLRGQD